MKTAKTGLFIGLIFSVQIFPQWFWQNPSPHGNLNNRLDFSSSNSFTVVGNAGTIIRTNNNGASWDRQFSPTNNDLKDIDYFQSGIAIIVGNKGTILRTSNGGNNWDVVSGGTTTNLTAVEFLNASDGIITGWNGLILRTTNGGSTWDSIATPTSQRLYGISFLNSSSGMVVGDGGVILKTANGGLTWTLLASGTVQSLYDISYVTSNVAVAAGWGGTVIRTTNGGTSWYSAGSFSFIRYGVSFTSADHGVVAGENNQLNLTTDGGVTWTTAISNEMATNFHCVKFYNSNVGVAVGEFGAIFRTVDAGETWQTLTQGTLPQGAIVNGVNRNNLYSVHCINSSRAVITGSSEIFITNNSGVSWNSVMMFDYPRVDDVSFATPNVGVALGINQNLQGSAILKTVNGGSDWSVQLNSSSVILNSIDLSTPTHGVAVGNGGKIFRTINGGQNWTEQVPPQPYDIYDVFLVDSLIGYTVGRYGNILKTTDGGFSWVQVHTNIFYNFYGVAFTDANNGIAVGDSIKVGVSHGLILKTTDGGATWNRKVIDVPLVLKDVNFTNSGSWYTIGNIPGNGITRIFKSDDFGNNWDEQIPDIAISRNVRKISAFDDSNLLIVGYGGSVIRGINGGSPNRAINNTITNLNLPINNVQNATSTMTFTPPGDQPGNTTFSENIVSVEVTINEVIHTRTGDLTFALEHSGVTATIISEVGGNGQHFISTVLNDNASIPIANGEAPFTGFFIPSNPLSVFNGMNAYGDWTLTVSDGYTGNDGILNSWSLLITLDSPNDIEEEDNLTLADFALYQNYPNPFNPSTRIKYQISGISQVSLKVYDLLGRKVATLVNEEKPAGTYEVTFDASRFASGVYFYQLKANVTSTSSVFTQTKKLLLLK